MLSGQTTNHGDLTLSLHLDLKCVLLTDLLYYYLPLTYMARLT